ncbi:MAG: hypothetical protein OYH76_09175 [Defluviicoccus sp.]|nr:hypothetical protein [Defluviicoccus sp.]MDE0276055.1 hypothetical protein [Defluviicoccus sp.]
MAVIGAARGPFERLPPSLSRHGRRRPTIHVLFFSFLAAKQKNSWMVGLRRL